MAHMGPGADKAEHCAYMTCFLYGVSMLSFVGRFWVFHSALLSCPKDVWPPGFLAD